MLIQLFLGGPDQIKHESEQNTKVNKTFLLKMQRIRHTVALPFLPLLHDLLF